MFSQALDPAGVVEVALQDETETPRSAPCWTMTRARQNVSHGSSALHCGHHALLSRRASGVS